MDKVYLFCVLLKPEITGELPVYSVILQISKKPAGTGLAPGQQANVFVHYIYYYKANINVR